MADAVGDSRGNAPTMPATLMHHTLLTVNNKDVILINSTSTTVNSKDVISGTGASLIS